MFEHFRDAQAPVYPTVLAELRAGQKRSHWMWFIFPQLSALGRSPTAKHFGLAGLDAARAFLADPLLGARLRECVGLVLTHPDRSAHQIFGSPDDLKFRSCLTLFAAAAPTDPLFSRALETFYAGAPDPLTLDLLGSYGLIPPILAGASVGVPSPLKGLRGDGARRAIVPVARLKPRRP